MWRRRSPLTKHERLLRLEKATAEREVKLTEGQTRTLECFSSTPLSVPTKKGANSASVTSRPHVSRVVSLQECILEQITKSDQYNLKLYA